jgi:selenocysteine-specific elongation factor
VVATPGSLVATHMVDVYLDLLKSAPRPLKHRAKVRFHTGTAEHLGTVILLDREELLPAESAFVQIRLDHPVAALRGDRFVLRSYSPVQTVGGGTILHPLPRKHKGHDKREAAVALKTLLDGTETDIILWHILDAGWTGLTEHELQVRANVSPKLLDKALQRFISQKQVILYDKENRKLLHPESMLQLEQAIVEQLTDYHQKFPLKTGMLKEELSAQLPRPVDVKLYNFVLRHLAEQNMLAQEMEWVRLMTHKVDLTRDEEAIREKIEKAFREGGLQPPFFKDVAEKLPGTPRQHQDVLQWMISKGIIAKTKEDLYFHTSALNDLQERLVAFLKEHGEISTPQFKEMTGASRKYTIPLLEYFDMQKVTIRIGDMRRLRESKAGQSS